MEPIKENELSEFYQQFNTVDVNLKKRIMEQIISRQSPTLAPVSMPSGLFWGIVATFFGLISLAFYFSQPITFQVWNSIEFRWPKIPALEQVVVHPSLGLAMVALSCSVWVILAYQYKLQKTGVLD